jgi:hypothetical protein
LRRKYCGSKSSLSLILRKGGSRQFPIGCSSVGLLYHIHHVRTDFISWKIVERRMTEVCKPSLFPWCQIDRFKDDFRTILQQARGHVRTLISLSRTVTSPPTSPGSSITPQAKSLHDPETTRARSEAMIRLIGLLQRNLRVQYELDVVQVAHAYAILAFFLCMSHMSLAFSLLSPSAPLNLVGQLLTVSSDTC